MSARAAPRLKCSSCHRTRDEVRALINANGFYICDGCVELCNEIIEEDLDARGESWTWRRVDRRDVG
jgi:ATP-dependent Clp protease ATP-binding subunit ClpX